MAEKGFGIKELNIIGSTGTPLIESKVGLNIRVGTGFTVGIGTTGLTAWLETKANADPDNLSTLNAGIVTANYYYGDGRYLKNVGSGSLSDLDVIQYKLEGTERSCANPISVAISGVGVTIGIASTSNAFGARFHQGDDPTTEAGGSNVVCDGDLWFTDGGGTAGNPAGSDGTIQYNNDGVFGGAAYFTYIDSGLSEGNVYFNGAAANVYWDRSNSAMVMTNGANFTFGQFTGTNNFSSKIYGDGNGHGFWDATNGTGDIYIRGSSTAGGTHGIYLKPNTLKDSVVIKANSGIELYDNNVLKFATTTEGIKITGTPIAAAVLELYEAGNNGVSRVRIKSPDELTENYTLTLPVDDGLPDQVLSTNGGGTLSWVANSGGGGGAAIPGGSDTEVQYNNDGVFGGIIGFKYDASNTRLTLIDDYKLKIGSGTDQYVEIYHQQSDDNTYIQQQGNADLIIAASDNIILRQGIDEKVLVGNEDGSTDLHFNGGTRANLKTTIDGIAIFGNENSTAGGLRLYEKNNSSNNYAEIRGPEGVTASYTLTLPVDDGIENQILQTDGSGVLTWVNQQGGSGSGAPGGSNKQVQYNDNNVLAGASTLEYDKSGDATLIKIGGFIKTQKSGGDNYASLSSDGGVEIKRNDQVVNTSSGPYLDFKTTATDADARIQMERVSGAEFGSLIFYTNGWQASQERLRIGKVGQIGIAGANYGTAGQVLKSGGPNGSVVWGNESGGGGGGTPDTPLNSFQFNESSSFGGADHFKYDSTTGGVVFDDGADPADSSKSLKTYVNNHAVIEAANTALILQNNSIGIQLKPGTSHSGLNVNYQGSVEAYYNNTLRLSTTDDGADVGGTGSIKIPVGTTNQRNSSPVDGDIRYNSQLTVFEGYGNGAWKSFSDSSGGGAVYTLPAGGNQNAVTLTLTSSSGVPAADVVTISKGSNISFSDVTEEGFAINAVAGAGMGVDANIADLIEVDSANIKAKDAGADKIMFWDDDGGAAEGEGKATYLTVGDGLEIEGTTLKAEETSGGNDYLIPVFGNGNGTSGIRLLKNSTAVDTVSIFGTNGITVKGNATEGNNGTTIVIDGLNAGGGGAPGVDATVSNVFEFDSTNNLDIAGTGPGADRIIYWDQDATTEEGALQYLSLDGNSLEIAEGHVLKVKPGSNVFGVDANIAQLLENSTGNIKAKDAAADKIMFWDDSESKARYLSIGGGLAINDTEITASVSATAFTLPLTGSNGFDTAGNALIKLTPSGSSANADQTIMLVQGDGITLTPAEAGGTNGQVTISAGGSASPIHLIKKGDTSAEVYDTATGDDGYFKVVIDGTEALRVKNNRELLLKKCGTEGGHVDFEDAGGSAEWGIDVVGSGAASTLRFIDQGNSAARFAINKSGAFAVNNQFGTPGQVLQSNGSTSPPTWGGTNTSGAGGATPVGGIIIWNGSSAAISNLWTSGWYLCDGGTYNVNGTDMTTPDLRNKFIVGASAGTGDNTYPGLSPGAQGGSANAVTVSHSHSIDHTHLYTDPTIGNYPNLKTDSHGSAVEYPTVNGGTTSAASTSSSGSVGEDAVNKNLPPYYALCYIIRLF